MTIYQEEMLRKANHHECEATYDETTGRLRITYDGQHLMDMDERGYPFNFSGKTDPHGLYIGRDKYGTNTMWKEPTHLSSQKRSTKPHSGS